MSLIRDRAPFATLVLPVYNAAPFVARTLRTVLDWLETRKETWEWILVDDASTDGTRAILDEFVSRHRSRAVHLVRFSENRGKGFSVRAGLAEARGRYVLFTDCDLAYPLDNVGRIVSRLESGADAAVACRVLPESSYQISPSFFSYLYTRHLLGRTFNAICRMIAVPGIRDTQAGLKGFRRAAVRPVLPQLVLNRFSFDVELLRALIDHGASIEEVPVAYRYDSEPTTVEFFLDSIRMLRDLLRVRARSITGHYRAAQPYARPPRLVINADDYGIAPGVNRAVQEGLESGSIHRASIMTGTPHAAAAIEWAARHPRHAFGVHLNLTLGRPVSPVDKVPSLVDRNGRFHCLPRFVLRYLTGRIRFEEIRLEFHNQVSIVKSAGIALRHLDSHHHIHLLRRLHHRVVRPLAEREGLPVRLMQGPVRGRFGIPDARSAILALISPRSEDSLHSFGTSLTRNPDFHLLQAYLSRFHQGRAYELTAHPGYVDEALRATGDAHLEDRDRERRLLISEEARILLALVEGNGISELPQITYRQQHA